MTIGEQARVVVLAIVGFLAGLFFVGIPQAGRQLASPSGRLMLIGASDEEKLKALYSAALPYGWAGLAVGIVVGLLVVMASRPKTSGVQSGRPAAPQPDPIVLLHSTLPGLQSPDPRIRERSASVLGDLGAGAASALPKLEALRADQSRRVRGRAAWAIENINRKVRETQRSAPRNVV